MSSAAGASFRQAEPHDAAAIRELVRSAYAKWVPLVGREPRPMQADYDKGVLEHRFDLVEEDGVLTGLIETVVRDDHLWIESIAVAPMAQGRGIGRRLLAHAEVLAREAGRNETRLLTNSAMETNIALYRRVGYVEVRREPFLSGFTVYMRKTLVR